MSSYSLAQLGLSDSHRLAFTALARPTALLGRVAAEVRHGLADHAARIGPRLRVGHDLELVAGVAEMDEQGHREARHAADGKLRLQNMRRALGG